MKQKSAFTMEKRPISACLLISACLSLFSISACAPQANETPQKTETAASANAQTAASQASAPSQKGSELNDFRALYLQDGEQSEQIINSKRIRRPTQAAFSLIRTASPPHAGKTVGATMKPFSYFRLPAINARAWICWQNFSNAPSCPSGWP